MIHRLKCWTCKDKDKTDEIVSVVYIKILRLISEVTKINRIINGYIRQSRSEFNTEQNYKEQINMMGAFFNKGNYKSNKSSKGKEYVF